MILKRMKRRHSRAHAIAFCEEARRLRPDIVVRRRHHRRLSDGDRGDVRQFGAHDRGLRADLPACVSLFAAPGNARRADAAARPARHERTRRAASPYWQGALSMLICPLATAGASRCSWSKDNVGRTPQFAELTLDEGRGPGRLISASVTGHEAGRLKGTALS